MTVLLFTQAEPGAKWRSHGVVVPERRGSRTWSRFGHYMTRAQAWKLTAHRWALVECENADAGRLVLVECEARPEMTNGIRNLGRIIAQGGRE